MSNAKGAKELTRYLNGGKLTLKQAILAKCFDCMGNYADGKVDCQLEECGLYPFMPYGSIWKGREKKIIPEDRRKAILQALKRGRKTQIRKLKEEI